MAVHIAVYDEPGRLAAVQEVRRPLEALEAHQIRAQDAFEYFVGQCAGQQGEIRRIREGHVAEVADGPFRARLAKVTRDGRKLIVVDQDRYGRCGTPGDSLRYQSIY